jgi:hypothetical protein
MTAIEFNEIERERRVHGERLLVIKDCLHNFVYIGIVACGMRKTCSIYWCPKCGKEVEREIIT